MCQFSLAVLYWIMNDEYKISLALHPEWTTNVSLQLWAYLLLRLRMPPWQLCIFCILLLQPPSRCCRCSETLMACWARQEGWSDLIQIKEQNEEILSSQEVAGRDISLCCVHFDDLINLLRLLASFLFIQMLTWLVRYSLNKCFSK